MLRDKLVLHYQKKKKKKKKTNPKTNKTTKNPRHFVVHSTILVPLSFPDYDQKIEFSQITSLL